MNARTAERAARTGDGNRYHVNGTVCLASEDECAEARQAERWPEEQRAQRRLHVLNGWPPHRGCPCRCTAPA